jgi:hypothetical protein
MIIKRISQSLLSQNWKELIVELLVVIVGVFLAIQVENWNESRKESAQEKALLESLRGDFIENRKIGDRKLEQYARAGEAALELRRMATTETEVDAIEFYTLEMDAGAVQFPRFISSTWDLLTADGQLTLVKNGSIKKKIADFYQHTDGFFQAYLERVPQEREDMGQYVIDHHSFGRLLYQRHPDGLEGLGFEEENSVAFTVASKAKLEILSLRMWHTAFDFMKNMENAMDAAREIEESISAELSRFE